MKAAMTIRITPVMNFLDRIPNTGRITSLPK